MTRKNNIALLFIFCLLFLGCSGADMTIEEPEQDLTEEEAETICPDDQHPHLIDMGNGTKWSCCNIGASSPYSVGNHYSWGETEIKSSYSYYDNYEIQHNVWFPSNIAATKNDVAWVKSGGTLRMPTISEFQELLNNSNIVWWDKENQGACFISKINGNKLFIPAGGWIFEGENLGKDRVGILWSAERVVPLLSSFMQVIHEDGKIKGEIAASRYSGHNVRGVANDMTDIGKNEEIGAICPDNQHPHLIDMGNGVKWSCCNIGASSPYLVGDHYSWGETEVKSSYSYYDNYEIQHNVWYPSNIAATEHDVAWVKSGGELRMPTISEFRELLNNSNIVWRDEDKENQGAYLISKINGNKLFIPAGGWIFEGENMGKNQTCILWSAERVYFPFSSFMQVINEDGKIKGEVASSRYSGHNVRGVANF